MDLKTPCRDVTMHDFKKLKKPEEGVCLKIEKAYLHGEHLPVFRQNSSIKNCEDEGRREGEEFRMKERAI